VKKNLLNALVFQVGWFVCVLGGNFAALIYTAIALLFHHQFILIRPRQWYVLLAIAAGGCLLDILLVQTSIIHFENADVIGIPIWLMCLWLLFATTFQYCLGWLRRYLWLAVILAAVFGPMTYWLGANLADASIAAPLLTSLSIMAAGWALLFPTGIYFANPSRAQR